MGIPCLQKLREKFNKKLCVWPFDQEFNSAQIVLVRFIQAFLSFHQILKSKLKLKHFATILQMLIKLIEQLKIFLIWIEKGDYYLYFLVTLEGKFWKRAGLLA